MGGGEVEKAGSLLPTEETIAPAEPAPEPEKPLASALAQEARDAMAAPDVVEAAPNVESVFAKLKDLKRDETPEAEAETSHEDTPSE